MYEEAKIKKDLMNHEFQLNLKLKQLEVDALKNKETIKEDRKDERTRIQATQQSEMIDQRNNQKPPKNFETEKGGNLPGQDMSALGLSM